MYYQKTLEQAANREQKALEIYKQKYFKDHSRQSQRIQNRSASNRSAPKSVKEHSNPLAQSAMISLQNKSTTPFRTIQSRRTLEERADNRFHNQNEDQKKSQLQIVMEKDPWYQVNKQKFYGCISERGFSTSRNSLNPNQQIREQSPSQHSQKMQEPDNEGERRTRLKSFEKPKQLPIEAYWQSAYKEQFEMNPVTNLAASQNDSVFATAYRGKGLRQLQLAIPKSLDNR